MDASGNIYTAGYQSSTGAYTYGGSVSVTGTYSGGSNAVLVKYDAAGTAQWAKTVTTGSGDSYFNAAAVDSSGNIYAAGYQSGTGAYTYGSSVSVTGTGTGNNVVLVKYDPSGTALWARTVTAGSNSSAFNAAAVDASGNIYTAGYQSGTGAYTYGSSVSVTGTGTGNNVVLVKYDPSGTALWARTVTAGSNSSAFNAVAADSSGNIYAVGHQDGTGAYTYGSGVSITGTYTGTGGTAVLVKYNAAGTAQWAKTVTTGSNNRFSFTSVAADASGSIYASGRQNGTGAYNYGSGVSITGTYSGGSNAVLVKYDAAGTAQWAKTVTTGSNYSYFNAVSADSSGSIYAAGYQYGTGAYNYGSGNIAGTASTDENAVLVKYVK